MTQTKAYNLKVYCEMKKIDIETEEAKEFLDKTFYEQLTIIKGLKTNRSKEVAADEEEEHIGYSILDRIIKK